MEMQATIKHFTDYRGFLIAYAQAAKKNNPRWSYSVWARQLGLHDKSSIGKIIRGTRNPSKDLLERIVNFFDFDAGEKQYFNDLVSLQKLKKNPRLSVMILEKIGKKHPQEALKILDFQELEIISKWYCTAIREMTQLDEFVADPKWISKKLQFRVSPKEVGHAIKLLEKANLLSRNGEGELIFASGRLRSGSDISSEAIKTYHRSMLENAKTALDLIPVELREFSASVLTMNFENVPLAKEYLVKSRRKFCELFEEKGGNGLFQVQVQFFPLTKKRSARK